MKRIAYFAAALLALVSCSAEVSEQKNVQPSQEGFDVTNVTISQNTLVLEEGATAVLAARVSPPTAREQRVQWSTSNSSVAVVDDGRVTAVRVGDAVITVVTVDGGYKDECKATVTASSAPSVTYDARVSAIGAVLSGKANISTSSISSDLSMGMMLSESAGMIPTNSKKIAASDIGADYSYSVYFPLLEPEKVYYYRSYISQNGQDTCGEIKTFTTPPAVETLEPLDVGVRYVDLVGRVNLIEEDYASHLSVEYGIIFDGKKHKGRQVGEDGKFTVTVVGLEPEKTYSYNAYVEIDKELASSGKSLSYSGAALSVTTGTIHVTGIHVSDYNPVLEYGSAVVLTATVVPSDAVYSRIRWSISDENVLSFPYISSGYGQTVQVKGVGLGEAVVTATAGGMGVECGFSVQGLKTNISEAVGLYPGEEFQIEAEVYPHADIKYESTDAAVAYVTSTGLIGAHAPGTCGISITAGDFSYYFDVIVYNVLTSGAADLGLPSGLKWAACNLGAERPEDYGDYYAWGETKPKSDYSWKTYKWCNGSYDTLTKYNYKSSHGTVDGNTVLETEDDAAHENLGGKWRIPSEAEWKELMEECTWTRTTVKGVHGCLITGKNNYGIFLPDAGCRGKAEIGNGSSYGYYWSSSLDKMNPFYARYVVSFGSGHVHLYNYDRCNGHSVRPVAE